MKKCISCGAKVIVETTTDVTNYGGCIIIVENVPCIKCIECREFIYTYDVIKRLKKIVASKKTESDETITVNYTDRLAKEKNKKA